jgi:hypothetical protein
MSTTWQYRPSKRPKVSQVEAWDHVYSDYNYTHWRGDDFAGEVLVERGYPFPDYYKVTFRPKNGKRVSKLFYGETAWMDTERYVYDLGFPLVSGQIN